MGRRLFIAMFGGRDPGMWKIADREGYDYKNMDGPIADAYHIAVRTLGGESYVERQAPYSMTHAERLKRIQMVAPQLLSNPDNEYARNAEQNPDGMANLVGQRRTAIPAVSNNTFISTAESLPRAINIIMNMAGPNDKIAELVLLDHGLMLGGEFDSMRFGVDMISAYTTSSDRHHVRHFAGLKRHVDPQTIVTLAGCSVASNAKGRQLLKNIALILGVKTQGFTEDQLVLFPGIEGRVVHCNAQACTESPGSATTPFSKSVYGNRTAWGNEHPGWE